MTWEEKFFACPVLALCQSRGWSVALHGALQQKAMRHDPVQGKHVPDHVFDGALHASQHPPPLRMQSGRARSALQAGVATGRLGGTETLHWWTECEFVFLFAPSFIWCR